MALLHVLGRYPYQLYGVASAEVTANTDRNQPLPKTPWRVLGLRCLHPFLFGWPPNVPDRPKGGLDPLQVVDTGRRNAGARAGAGHGGRARPGGPDRETGVVGHLLVEAAPPFLPVEGTSA